jgi:hypothetical protein
VPLGDNVTENTRAVAAAAYRGRAIAVAERA